MEDAQQFGGTQDPNMAFSKATETRGLPHAMVNI